MYIAKLDDDTDPSAVDRAIRDAIDRGYVRRNFGKFWIVLGHIVIDRIG